MAEQFLWHDYRYSQPITSSQFYCTMCTAWVSDPDHTHFQVDIHRMELNRIANALERIADALERRT